MTSVAVDDVVAQLSIWGWALGHPARAGRTAAEIMLSMRSGDVALVAEAPAHLYSVGGWWDLGLGDLWQIRLSKNGTDVPTPWWYALAGLLHAEDAWWL